MTLIRTQDVIQSVAEALQYISYYHPADFVRAVSEAYEMEESAAAKTLWRRFSSTLDCALRKRPICQIPVSSQCSSKWGSAVGGRSVTHRDDQRRRQAGFRNPDNVLRASILSDPAGARKIPVTTRQRSFTLKWFPVTNWRSSLPPKAEVRKTKPKW